VVKIVVVSGPSHQEMYRKHCKHRKHPNSMIQYSIKVKHSLQDFGKIHCKHTRTSKNLMRLKWLLKLMLSNSGEIEADHKTNLKLCKAGSIFKG
jgi:hypothetical protein